MLTKVKGPKTYYAAPSFFKDTDFITNTNRQVGPFQSNFKIGSDGLFNLDKLRVITEISISCKSNIISNILKETFITENGSSSKIDTFRLNPGGFVGFNIYTISKQQWEDIFYRN